MATDSDSLVPLVIGVTGHRTFLESARPEIESKVFAFLDRLRTLAHPSPLVVLSPLALGCDRIAARAAIRLRDRHGGVRLIVPMPFAAGDYRDDFDTEADRAEFEELLGHADGRFELRYRRNASLIEGRLTPGPERNLHYRRLGLYIAMQSHAVIGMWNGASPAPDTVGGTGDIIQFCRTGGPGLLSPEELEDLDVPFRSRRPLLFRPQPTPLLVVPVPRGRPDDRPEITAAHELETTGILADLGRSTVPMLAAINRLLVPWHADGRSPSAARRERLDATADNGKTAYLAWTGRVGILLLIGVGCFQLFSSFTESLWWMLVPYLALLIAAVAVYRRGSRWLSVEDSYLLLRGTAEALRIQRGWHDGGLDESVADHQTARRLPDLADLRLLVLGATVDVPCDPTDPEGAHRWLRSQAEYFDPSGTAMQRREQRRRTHDSTVQICEVACVAFAVMALSTILALLSFGRSISDESLLFMGCLNAAIGIALATTVFIRTRQQCRLDREELESGRRMREIYQEADRRLSTARTAFGRTEVLKAIGKEALDEVAEWVIRHRGGLERPGPG